MGEHLQAAWENSAQFIELLAENLACELWENHAEAALSLDTPEGQLHRRLVDWLHLHPSLAGISIPVPPPSLRTMPSNKAG